MEDKQNFHFAGAYGGKVDLTFDAAAVRDANAVLVFAFYRGHLLMTKHKLRGWEVPGGKVEQGEWPSQAALRETYEEAGAEIDGLEWIAQYIVTQANEEPLFKSVYIARINRMHPLPDGFETEEIRLYDEPPLPPEVQHSREFSPIVQDQVYSRILEHLSHIQHPYMKKRGADK